VLGKSWCLFYHASRTIKQKKFPAEGVTRPLSQRDYTAARLEAEAAARRLAEAQITQGQDAAECQWALAVPLPSLHPYQRAVGVHETRNRLLWDLAFQVAKRLAGEANEGRAEMARAIEHYRGYGGSRLCSLCRYHHPRLQ
jgi:hypothetical protein